MVDRLSYIPNVCVAPELDIVTYDGINDKGLYYGVLSLSDGKLIRDNIWFLRDIVIFAGQESGTIAELRKKGLSWEKIFNGAVEASAWVSSKEITYN